MPPRARRASRGHFRAVAPLPALLGRSGCRPQVRGARCGTAVLPQPLPSPVPPSSLPTPPPPAAGALKFAGDFLPGPALSRAARCRAVTNSGTTLSRDKIAPGLFTRSMGVRYKREPGTAAPARRAVPPRAAACPRAPPPAGASAQPATGEAPSLLLPALRLSLKPVSPPSPAARYGLQPSAPPAARRAVPGAAAGR